MSTTYLKIIPTSPTYVPDKIMQEKAKLLLHKFYTAKQTALITTDSVEFVDQGDGFEKVSCNLCGHIIKIEDWQDAMEEAYKSHFKNLVFKTPCCHKNTSLNELHYQLPAGFAKFVVSIEDAGQELPQKDLKDLEKILDTPLRLIWAHY